MTQPANSIPAPASAASAQPAAAGAPGAAPALPKRQVATPYQSKATSSQQSAPALAQRAQQTRAQRAQEAANKASAGSAPAAPASKPAASQSAAVPPPVAAVATEGTSTAVDSGAAKPGVDAGQSAAADAATAPAQEKLPDGEYAKRMANLVREDGRIAAAKQELARAQAQHREALQRANVIDEIRTKGVPNKLAFLQQVFGWNVQSILDEIVTDGTRTPEQRAAQQRQLDEQRMAAIERQAREAARTVQQQQQTQQVQSYITGSINPIIDGSADFKIIRDAFGDDAGRQVYSVLAERYSKTKVVGDPKAVCKEVANYLRSEAEKSARLLGGASAPVAGQAAKQERATSPQAAPAPPTTGFAKRMRANAPSYKSRPIA